MSDLVEFLRACLAEDEQIVRAATQGDWVWSREFVTPPGYHHRTVGPLEPGDAAYIATWAPARVLREIDTKRELLAAVFAYEAKIDGEWGCCHGADEIAAGLCEEIQPKDITALRLMASVYRDREGFREEWSL